MMSGEASDATAAPRSVFVVPGGALQDPRSPRGPYGLRGGPGALHDPEQPGAARGGAQPGFSRAAGVRRPPAYHT